MSKYAVVLYDLLYSEPIQIPIILMLFVKDPITSVKLR